MVFRSHATDGSSGLAPGSSDSSLLARVKHRDADAWQRMVALYGPLVYHWCRAQRLQPNDAADVCQEVFASVFKSVETFQPAASQGSFRAWLWGITRHRLLDFYRDLRARPQAAGGTSAQEQSLQLPDSLDDSPPDEPVRGQDPVWGRAIEMVRAQFEPHTWRAFWRVVVDGQRPADVAEELTTTIAAVYQAKARVLRELRRQMSDLEEIA